MTFVYCRKYGERVCIWSDFVISDEIKGKTEVFPGILKSVIINHTCTISFSGNINHAISAIKSAMLDKTHDEIRKILVDSSEDTDFILVYHNNGANIEKISKGNIYFIDNECWIGNPAAASTFYMHDEKELDINGIPDFIDMHELLLNKTLSDAFHEHGFSENDGYGYFYCQTICSPLGHCYENSASVSYFDTVDLSIGITKEQEYDAQTGMTKISVHKHGNGRGSHIFGVYLEQIKVGVLYDIHLFDYRENTGNKKYYNIDYSEFISEIRKESKKYGSDEVEVHYSLRWFYELKKNLRYL